MPSREFYDYIAKYHDKDSQLIIPARISEKTAKRVQEVAVKAFRPSTVLVWLGLISS